MNSQTTTISPNPKNPGQPSAPKAKLSTAPVTSAPAQKNQTGSKPAPETHPKPGPASIETHFESPSAQPRETSFHLDAPSAHEVLLAGEFTQWDKTPIKLIKGGGGIWHTKVTLAPGRYLYRFLVDGQWCDDPECTVRESNPYGGQDSVRQVI